MKTVFILIVGSWICMSPLLAQQVGINTNNPDGTTILDVQASNKGILPPRVALTSLTATTPITNAAGNPATLAEMPDALLIYNTATTGTPPNNLLPGYYFWDKANNKWKALLNLNTGDEDWYEEGTVDPPNSISDNIYTLGNVGIGTTAPTQTLDVAGQVRIRGGNPEAQKVLVATGTDGTGEWGVPRLNYAPYGTPTYYWDGATAPNCSGITGIASTKGSVSINSSSYCGGTGWNFKKMIELSGQSGEGQSNNTVPANGLYLTVPATAGVHNTFMLSLIDGDRWSTVSCWLCNSAGSNCVKLFRTSNNTNGSTAASTYTLGPNNNVKETSMHAWLNFPIAKDLVDSYINGGNLRLLITSAPNNSSTLWISGVACVPNPGGFIQHPAVSIHWGLNGNAAGEIPWNNSAWNNEGLGQVNGNSTSSFHIKIMDPTKDVIVTFYEHGANWHGSSPFITVGADLTIFRPRRGLMCAGSMMYKDKQYMSPQSFVIPASIVQAQLITTSSGVTNVLRLNVRNTGGSPYHFRGVDTEIY